MHGRGLAAAGVLGVLALCAFGYSCSDYNETRARANLRHTGMEAQGKVTNSNSWTSRRRRGGRTTHYSLGYAFAVNDRPVSITDRRVGGLRQVGSPMPVWYDPTNPVRCISQAELNYGASLSSLGWGVLMVGVVCLIAAGKAIRG